MPDVGTSPPNVFPSVPVSAHQTWVVASIWAHVGAAAAKAIEFLKEIEGDWETIKTNPAYGTLVTLAVSVATKSLTAAGVPVGPLVNVGQAVIAALDAMAAAHPGIDTSPAPVQAAG
jgi:hypothetical protein